MALAFLVQPSAAAELQGSSLSSGELAAAQSFTQQLGVVEWLGPLAPVALSPFFGIALLSGLSLFGGSWVSPDNPFLGEQSPLANPAIFGVFLVLTVLTSLPRLTKVSKPFAQAVDQAETWAGIITLMALRLFGGSGAEGPEVAMAHAGLFSTSMDAILMVAAAVNVFVINAVKFFFEMLVWITPVPFLDALFEAANKSACAGLMAIYVFSPTLATIINLVLFAFCLIVFRWAYRRQMFYRTVLFGMLRTWLWKPGGATPKHLVVFPVSELGPFQDRARCRFEKIQSGWRLTQRRLFRSPLSLDLSASEVSPEIEQGFFTNVVRFTGSDLADCSFSRKHDNRLDAVASNLGLGLGATTRTAGRPRAELKAELG